jgi:type IV pilus assembly protein PilM
MRNGLRSRPWVGLDLGRFSVKLLSLQPGVGGARFRTAEVVLPPTNGNGGEDRPAETIANAISECFAQVDLSPRGCRGISMGVAGTDVIVKHLSLPLIDESEVAPALRFEARKHLPFDPQSMVLDFQVVGRYHTERKLEILFAAVSQEHMERTMAPMRLIGVEPDIVDAAPLALANALMADHEMEPGAHVLVDIGESSSHLVLFQRGQPFFTRRLDFGGRHLTQAIAEGTRVPPEEAEEWKLTAGADQPGIRVDWDSAEMRAVLDALRNDLADELRRSFAFYRTQGTLPEPLRMWVSGGSARLPGLAARLGEVLGIPVALFDPFARLGHQDDSRAGPQYAQAYGLALRGS